MRVVCGAGEGVSSVSSLDGSVRFDVIRVEDTACADCVFRDPNPLKTGLCAVYCEQAKPARVFDGIACDYYEREEASGGASEVTPGSAAE